MRQMNTIVPEDLPELVKDLRKANGWTDNGQVVTTAIYALRYLLEERHDKEIEKATEAGIDQDVLDLFKRLTRVMPGRLVDDKLEWARLSDGRPALILREEWYIADDGAGELMAVRRDGGQVGYVARGDVQVLAERDIDGDVRPLQQPADEVALN